MIRAPSPHTLGLKSPTFNEVIHSLCAALRELPESCATCNHGILQETLDGFSHELEGLGRQGQTSGNLRRQRKETGSWLGWLWDDRFHVTF